MNISKVVKRRLVLSIDGGGIRGIVPAEVCCYLEEKLGPLGDKFDLIVGTSTGGILAAGLAHPEKFTSRQLSDLYFHEGGSIFKRAWYDPAAILKVKYQADGLRNAMQRYYGNATLSQARTNVVITAFDEVRWEPQLFKSSKAKQDVSEDYMFSYAAQATASAPTYFPNLDGLVDGGVIGATNPAMIALTEAMIMWPGEPVFLLSIGTGRKQHAPVDAKATENDGQLKQLTRIVDMLQDGPERIVERQVSELLGADSIRIQKALADRQPPSPAMDDASQANMAALKEFGLQMIRDQEADLLRAVEICKE